MENYSNEGIPSYIKKIKLGSVGLTKAFLGIDRAPDDVIIKRKTICYKCPHRVEPKYVGGEMGKCGICGCFIESKVKINSSNCPKGLW